MKTTNGTGRRVTVNLTTRPARAADRSMKRSGDNLTDVINHALVRYDWLEEELAGGAQLLLRKKDGEVQRVTFVS